MDFLVAAASAGGAAFVGVATHFIAAEISGRYWVRQERWKLRSDTYRRVFDALARVRAELTWALELKDGDPDMSDASERTSRLEENRLQLKAATNFARAFLSEEAMKSLDRLEKGLQNARAKSGSDDALSTGIDCVDQASQALSEAAKKDFGL